MSYQEVLFLRYEIQRTLDLLSTLPEFEELGRNSDRAKQELKNECARRFRIIADGLEGK